MSELKVHLFTVGIVASPICQFCEKEFDFYATYILGNCAGFLLFRRLQLVAYQLLDTKLSLKTPTSILRFFSAFLGEAGWRLSHGSHSHSVSIKEFMDLWNKNRLKSKMWHVSLEQVLDTYAALIHFRRLHQETCQLLSQKPL